MTAQTKPNDPSMEEILSSIRRIIADDQAKAAQKTEPAPAPVAAVVAAAPPPPPVHDDVFDLTPELLAEPAEDYNQDDVDLLFREIEEDQQAEQASIAPDPVVYEPPPAAPVMQYAQPAPPPLMAPAPVFLPQMDMSSLISPQVGASVSGAFSQLAHTVLAQNARTLDDLVQEMLKPMLKGWLDENLPTVVERLVRAEIERVARGGR